MPGDVPVAVIERFAAADAARFALRQAVARTARGEPAQILHRIAPGDLVEIEDADELFALRDEIAEAQVAMAERQSLDLRRLVCEPVDRPFEARKRLRDMVERRAPSGRALLRPVRA